MKWLEKENHIIVGIERDTQKSKGRFLATQPEMLLTQESIKWLNTNAMNMDITVLPENIKNGFAQNKNVTCVNTSYGTIEEWLEKEKIYFSHKKKVVHILALGDVGSTVLIGLKLLGKDCIDKIGICDINETICKRWEYEMNQTTFPWEYDMLPEITVLLIK